MSDSGALQKPRGEYGAGRVFLRGNRVYIRWSRNGTRFCKRTELTVDDRNWERKAKKLLKQRTARVTLRIADPAEANVSYEGMRDRLLESYKAKGRRWLRHSKSGEAYIIGLTHLNEHFQGWPAAEIESDAVLEYVSKRTRESAKGGTINRELSLLRRMFRLAAKAKKLSWDLVPDFEMLAESPAREGFIEPEEYPRLRQELPDYLRPIVSLGFHCAMRLGEITALRWDWIDLEDAEIRIPAEATKTKKARVIPLRGEPLELVRIESQREPRGEFVFMRDGKRIRTFYKAWKRACCAAGLGNMQLATDSTTGDVKYVKPRPDRKKAKAKPRLRYSGPIFHDLRRSGIRNLVRAGVSEEIAMKISGHVTREVFERYNIKAHRDLTDAAEKLEVYLAARGEGDRRDTNGVRPHVATEAPKTEKIAVQ